MPQSIAYQTSTEEGTYQAATDAEVAMLIAEVEAATEAHEAAKIANPAPVGSFRYNAPERDAHAAALSPTTERLRKANAALSASRNLPVGTVVRFYSSEGWSGTTSDEGTITKVTATSYVIAKDGIRSSTARVSREHAHEYRASYGTSHGERSLSIVRTPAQDRVEAARERAENERRAIQNAERRAYNDAVFAADRAKSEQARVLLDATRTAVTILISKHRAEYDALVSVALDVLAQDTPGREASTPPTLPTA